MICALFREIPEVLFHPRARRVHDQVRGKILERIRFVPEREVCRVVFQEEVERVEDSQFRNEINVYDEGLGGLGKDESRQIITVRILLPVEEMFPRLNLQGVAADCRPAMGRGPQSYNMGGQSYQTVVFVACPMVQCDANAHTRCSFPVGHAGQWGKINQNGTEIRIFGAEGLPKGGNSPLSTPKPGNVEYVDMADAEQVMCQQKPMAQRLAL